MPPLKTYIFQKKSNINTTIIIKARTEIEAKEQLLTFVKNLFDFEVI